MDEPRNFEGWPTGGKGRYNVGLGDATEQGTRIDAQFVSGQSDYDFHRDAIQQAQFSLESLSWRATDDEADRYVDILTRIADRIELWLTAADEFDEPENKATS